MSQGLFSKKPPQQAVPQAPVQPGAPGQGPVPGARPVGGDRLPAPVRERRPGLAILGVLLVLVGALGAALLVRQVSNRVGAVEITARVPAGQSIPASAIQEVMVAQDTPVSFVPWDQRSMLSSNYYAVSDIQAGTLLTGQMLSTSPGSEAGRVIVGLSFKAGQFPQTLVAGSRVNIYFTGTAISGQLPKGVGPDNLMAQNCLVHDIFPNQNDTSQMIVTVSVPEAEAGPIVADAANASIGVGVIPSTSGQ